MANHTDEHGRSTSARSAVAKRMRMRSIVKHHRENKKAIGEKHSILEFHKGSRGHRTKFLTKLHKGHFNKQ